MKGTKITLAYGRTSVDENDYRDASSAADEYEGSAGTPRPRHRSQDMQAHIPDPGYMPQEDVPEGTPAEEGYPRTPQDAAGQSGALPRQSMQGTSGSFPRQGGYVRPARPRKTQPTITEPQNTKYPSDYTHDSGIAIGGGGPLSGASYRRSRSEMKRLRRDLHYGQYLEIPKGRRSIFASQERARRTKSVITLAIVVAILAIAAICVWQLMVSSFGL